MGLVKNRARPKQAGTKASTEAIILLIELLCVLLHKNNSNIIIMIIILYANIIEQNILNCVIYSPSV